MNDIRRQICRTIQLKQCNIVWFRKANIYVYTLDACIDTCERPSIDTPSNTQRVLFEPHRILLLQ